MGVHDTYTEPLVSRYTSPEMQRLFSDDFKFSTWRRCWVALAEAQMELGLGMINASMLDQMRAAVEKIDYDVASKKEAEIKHDVMAHVFEYGTHCPEAKGVIHLGATSMFVCDNTELIQMREALRLVKSSLLGVIANLAKFAKKHKSLVTLGYTHYQPAQPTTVGKRATVYLQDLLLDLGQLEHVERLVMARGAKGTVGTQASYMELFGDYDKVKALDELVSKKLGFDSRFPVTAQTYPRKLDALIAKSLAGIAESASKFAVDLRLLSNLKIIEEPFAKSQTGSSAMAYKRNPMRSERMTALSRKLIGLQQDLSHSAANQWLERTLDDSALRRMAIPQMFLLADAILRLYLNISDGMVVYPAQIKNHLRKEIPFMATEAILMEACKKGADRQEMHELIKRHSVAAARHVKLEGGENDLFERLLADKDFPLDGDFLESLVERPERFSGAAEMQTAEFLDEVVMPLLESKKSGDVSSELRV